MAGIPTKFVIADLVFAAVRTSAGPFADFLDDAASRSFAYLGVIGADWGDLMPARPDPLAPPNTPYFQAWLPVLQLLAGSPAVGSTPATNGLYRDLKTLRDTLAKLDGVIKDKSKFGLLDMKDELTALPDVINAIKKQMKAVSGFQAAIFKTIQTGASREKLAPQSAWFPRDTLHWSFTGRFLQALRQRADTSGDKRLKAFAFGAVVGYGAALCGNPFINSVVGGPYRNQWWRRRWISNFIDTWVWGFYGKGGAAKVNVPANGVPNPLYTNWPNVCEAKLHERITLPGIDQDAVLQSIRNGTSVPEVLPQAFLDYWLGAYQDAYGPPSPTNGVDDKGLQSSYAMMWLILWFQTSGEVIPCLPADRVNAPDDCGDRPDWVAVDGSTVVGGQVQSPPAPDKARKPSVAEEVSGIIAAILGALEIAEGLLVGGFLVIIGALLIVDAETDPDWDKLRCYAGWSKVFLFYITDAMHALLKWAGFAFPYTLELAHNELERQLGNPIEPFDAALITVQSPGQTPQYPASLWSARTPNWQNFPTEPQEPPAEFSLLPQVVWPFGFVDGMQFTSSTTPPAQVNPRFSLVGSAVPLVRDRADWVARRALLNTPFSTEAPFGNAVDVCLDLIFGARPADYLDWDLDADPGIGYPTWILPFRKAPRNTSIAEP